MFKLASALLLFVTLVLAAPAPVPSVDLSTVQQHYLPVETPTPAFSKRSKTGERAILPHTVKRYEPLPTIAARLRREADPGFGSGSPLTVDLHLTAIPKFTRPGIDPGIFTIVPFDPSLPVFEVPEIKAGGH